MLVAADYNQKPRGRVSELPSGHSTRLLAQVQRRVQQHSPAGSPRQYVQLYEHVQYKRGRRAMLQRQCLCKLLLRGYFNSSSEFARHLRSHHRSKFTVHVRRCVQHCLQLQQLPHRTFQLENKRFGVHKVDHTGKQRGTSNFINSIMCAYVC